MKPHNGRMRGYQSLRGALAIGAFLVAYVVICLFILMTRATAHDWFPPDCCSGFDCRVIGASEVMTTRDGFVLPGNPHVIPYDSSIIRQTPPEGDGAFAACTRGGKPDGEPICLYIPTWGS